MSLRELQRWVDIKEGRWGTDRTESAALEAQWVFMEVFITPNCCLADLQVISKNPSPFLSIDMFAISTVCGKSLQFVAVKDLWFSIA